jgi:type VI secretion system protein ImpH
MLTRLDPPGAAPHAVDADDATTGPGRAAGALHEALERDPDAHGFFEAVRRLERATPGLPRIGCSARPAEDPVRFCQLPSMAFAARTVAAFETREGGAPPRMAVQALGLFGPNGPLPGHLTEYAHERRHNAGDPTLSRFADVFHHRMLSLFFRAWATCQPAVDRERPAQSVYAERIGALVGIGRPPLRDRDALPDDARLHHAGHLAAQARHAEGLRSMIASLFGLPCEIEEFAGEWLAVPEESQGRLGSGMGSGLGVDAVAGRRTYAAQHRFRVRLGPMGLAQYRDFLPGRPALARLAALVRTHAGDELAWELHLVLSHDEVPAAALGADPALGWDCWLGARATTRAADDLHLEPAPARAGAAS